MIGARAYSLTLLFVVYKQEALILAGPMAVDMILLHSWNSFIFAKVSRCTQKNWP